MSGVTAQPRQAPTIGVRLAGTGHCVPDGKMTNADFEKLVETSDEWIVQRTGIRERRRCDPAKDESARTLCVKALRRALEDARMDPGELDFVILGSVTGEMTCPATACRVAAEVGAVGAGALDIIAACSSFVYGLNMAHDMIRSGAIRSAAVLGCDIMSEVMDYTDRGVAILFGDAAGAAIIKATDDTTRGIIASSVHADGSGWKELYLPRKERDLPEGVSVEDVKLGYLQMNGREVYKFAVTTFGRLIEETLEKAGLRASDIDMFVCHQSNARILESARTRFGIPESKLYVNIDRFGNCSGGSVPVVLDELRRRGKCREGDIVMFVAFGGGLTWASSLWRL